MTAAWLEELTIEECLALLQANAVGRIGVIYESSPFIFPINYRFVELEGQPALEVRTRPGNVIDLSENEVALEIDGIDAIHQRGWSVLVRGTLVRVATDLTLVATHTDPDSWVAEGRSSWLVLKPTAITGRRLIQASIQWAFHQSAYL